MVSNSVTMYDTDGEITAYSFELETEGVDSGYIVIPDIEDKILEFSDSSEPLYEAFSLASNDRIVFTGPLAYYKDSGTQTLLSVDNIAVEREEITNNWEAARSSEYISTLSASAFIEDPFVWAQKNYGGAYVSDEWINDFQEYEENHGFRIMSDFPGYQNHCGPTAITNLIEMYGAYYGSSKIASANYIDIFERVAELGIGLGYYSIEAGTYRSTLPYYIEDAFLLYGFRVTVTNRSPSFEVMKSQLSNYGPFYLTLNKHPDYGNHGVAGYAITRLRNTETGMLIGFVKIADGRASYGRYLVVSSLQTSEAVLRDIKIDQIGNI